MDLDFEPLSNRWQQDPYPIYRELRDRAPIYYASKSDNWVVSRYDDVAYVLKTPEIFASKRDRDRQMPAGDMGPIAAGCPVMDFDDDDDVDLVDFGQFKLAFTGPL